MYIYRAKPTCVATASCVPSSPEHRKSVAAILRSTTSRICAAAESSTRSSSTSFAAAPKCTRPRATCAAVASYTTNYPRRVAVAVDCSEKTDSRVVGAKLLSILFNGSLIVIQVNSPAMQMRKNINGSQRLKLLLKTIWCAP